MSGQDEKPFDVPKRLVWQAWKRVAVNGGAPGADGVTIEGFKADLGTTCTRSGTGCRRARTSRRRCGQ